MMWLDVDDCTESCWLEKSGNRYCSQTCKFFQPSLAYDEIFLRNLFVPALLLPAWALHQVRGWQNDRRNEPKGSYMKLTTDKIPLRVGAFDSFVMQKLKLSASMALCILRCALREDPPNLSWPLRALSPLLEQWRLLSCSYWFMW